MKQKIYVTRSSMPAIEEYIDEIKDIWESHWLTNMGEKHYKLQMALKEYLNVSQIELLINGHMALELSMQAMKLQGEVITTPYTFASTTHAIVRNGLQPVFCDIKMDDYTIDVSKIEERITERTCAIVPVHVYGNVCEVEKIEELAKCYGLKVIYDAAHAFGVKYKNIDVGKFGDASCFSFHATKVFNTIEGGAVCYEDETFGQELYRLKNFGIRGPESVDGIGANAKMNEFCAAMGLCNLKYIEEERKKRKRIVEQYTNNLNGIEGIKIWKEKENVMSNYAYFPIIIDECKYGVNRDRVFELLESEGIIVRKYFYPITTAFECYKRRFDAQETPNALYISEHVLTLPLYGELQLSDVDRICEIIIKSKDRSLRERGN